jgi:hypothetical protein
MSRSWYDTHLALAIAGAFFTLCCTPSQYANRQQEVSEKATQNAGWHWLTDNALPDIS